MRHSRQTSWVHIKLFVDICKQIIYIWVEFKSSVNHLIYESRTGEDMNTRRRDGMGRLTYIVTGMALYVLRSYMTVSNKFNS